MGLPEKPVALSPEQIAELNRKLSMARHNINNYLALIVAAAELIRRKPEMTQRLVESILQQPERIISEVRAFSNDFEVTLEITRDSGFQTSPPMPPTSFP
jgi:hypothetical protein